VSVYLPADLRRRIRAHFADCCAYCRTAEKLTVAIFEFGHIIPRSAGGGTVFANLCAVTPDLVMNMPRRRQAPPWSDARHKSLPIGRSAAEKRMVCSRFSLAQD
jgi:hypothetical protein